MWLLLPILVALVVVCALFHTECRRCGSSRTFNWATPTIGFRIHGEKVNQYCFRCADLTASDISGEYHMFLTLRWRIAVRHHDKHSPESWAWTLK